MQTKWIGIYKGDPKYFFFVLNGRVFCHRITPADRGCTKQMTCFALLCFAFFYDDDALERKAASCHRATFKHHFHAWKSDPCHAGDSKWNNINIAVFLGSPQKGGASERSNYCTKISLVLCYVVQRCCRSRKLLAIHCSIWNIFLTKLASQRVIAIIWTTPINHHLIFNTHNNS